MVQENILNPKPYTSNLLRQTWAGSGDESPGSALLFAWLPAMLLGWLRHEVNGTVAMLGGGGEGGRGGKGGHGVVITYIAV